MAGHQGARLRRGATSTFRGPGPRGPAARGRQAHPAQVSPGSLDEAS